MSLPSPWFMYGTAWKEDATERLVGLALEAGFRAIDTANQRKHYYEEGVGRALSRAFDAGSSRTDVFIQTKFTFVDGQDHRLPYDPRATIAEQVQQSFESSLEHLGLEHLDSLVLHGPSAPRGLADEDYEAWRAMESLYDAGHVRHLGVSNVDAEQLEMLLGFARVRPTFVQNRCYAELGWDADVRAVCRRETLVYQGFSLLTANRHVLSHPQVAAIARAHAATPAQVIFRFCLSLGMLPLTGTSDSRHMKEDLAASTIELSSTETSVIEKLGDGGGISRRTR